MFPGVSDSDIVRPTSPEHAQMLSDARQYAAEATQRATETFSQRVAQATRRATEIGLREMTARRRTGQSDSEATEHALENARQYAAELTQQATDRLRHETATGLRLGQYSAETILRSEPEVAEAAAERNIDTTWSSSESVRPRLDARRRSANYDPGDIDSELEDRARQVVANAVQRARQRERQASEVRQRAQHSISVFDQWAASTGSIASRLSRIRDSLNSENENSNTDESVLPLAVLGDADIESASNTEENGEIQIEDIEISIPNDSNHRNFDTDTFTTENYDAELNNILGIETDVSNQTVSDEERQEAAAVNPSAEIKPFVIDSSSNRIGASEAVSAGLIENDNYDNSIGAEINDSRGTTRADNSVTNTERETAVLNRRGMWSPPPRRLSPAELAGDVENQNMGEPSLREEVASQSEDSVQNDIGHLEIEQRQAGASKFSTSKVSQNLEENNHDKNNENQTQISNQECLNCQSKQELKFSGYPTNTSNPKTEYSKSRINKAPTSLSGTSMLTRYLQLQKGASNTSKATDIRSSTTVFPSIRERLQTNIPLTSCDSPTRSSSVRVLSSRGEIPVVTVVSASESSTITSSLPERSRPMVAGLTDVFSTNGANVRSGLSTAISSNNARSRLHSSSALSNAALSGINYPPIVPTVIASTSSHASLFQNIYHNSRGTYNYNSRGGFGGGQIRNTTLSSSRTQPYLQNRSRFLSLMGPYLESRGVGLNRINENNSDNSTVPSQTATSLNFGPSPYPEGQTRVSYPSLHLSAVNPPTTLSNTLESSDTESELNTHLHNRAYFLPISEDQTRTVSSTSIQSTSSIESSDNVVLRQRSVSRDSVDSVLGHASVTEVQGHGSSATDDFVQDMHRFSRNTVLETERQRQQNNPQNLNESCLFNQDDNNNNQDDNNNTIQVSDNSRNSTQAGQGPESFLALRNNLVTMTDQIEQEMNELNRRINALRDSFNQSLQALRQDRERYQSLGRSLTETNTNVTPITRVDRGENSSRVDNSNEPRAVPVIRVTGLEDHQASSHEESSVPENSEGNFANLLGLTFESFMAVWCGRSLFGIMRLAE